MFYRKHIKILVTMFLSLMIISTAVFGQGTGATLSGTVQDAMDKAIPKVAVTALNAATGIERKVTTNNRGHYTFMNLAPGTYEIIATATGFETYATNVRLVVSARGTLNIRMTDSEADPH